MDLQERDMKSTLKSTGEMFGIHREFTRGIFWVIVIPIGKIPGFPSGNHKQFFPNQKRQSNSYLTPPKENEVGKMTRSKVRSLPLSQEIAPSIFLLLEGINAVSSDNHLNKLSLNRYLFIRSSIGQWLRIWIKARHQMAHTCNPSYLGG
jgi:hypothetical protein